MHPSTTNAERGVFEYMNGTSGWGIHLDMAISGYGVMIGGTANYIHLNSPVKSGNIDAGNSTITAKTFSGNASTASAVSTSAENSSTASRYILFANNASGNQALKTDSGLKYVPSTNTITATLAGNATSATSATSANRLHRLGDNRHSFNPSQVTGGSLITTFSTQGALANQVNDSDYSDVIAINSYSDSSAGRVNALSFDKSSYRINHFMGTYGASTWSGFKTLAYLTDNVASATKLQTARTIWGQSFNGEGNVTGNISSTGNITPLATAAHNIGTSSLMYEKAYIRRIDTQSGYNLRFNVAGSEYMTITTSGNVGIGTTSPAHKLDVSGDVRASGTFRGSLTGNASSASAVSTSAENSSTASRYILFANNASGNQALKTDSGLKYVPSTNTISATFSGNLTGNVTGNSDTATDLKNIITSFTGEYPLTVNVNGTIYSHTGMTYKGSTGELKANKFVGALAGNATSSTTATTASKLTINSSASAN